MGFYFNADRGSPLHSFYFFKTIILFLVSSAGIITPLSSLMYTPALPAIASGLGVSISRVNLTITLYLIFQGVMPCVWGTLGDTYGRRPLYIITLVFTLAASIGLCFTNSFAVVLILRALHATGCSATRTLGAGLIRDITPPSTRGSAMGMYSAGSTIGTAAGPVLGGIIAQYAGWHAIFYLLAALAAFVLVSVVLFLPETHRDIVGNGSLSAPKHLRPPIQCLFPTITPPPDSNSVESIDSPRKVEIDLIKSLMILKYPVVSSSLMFSGICYGGLTFISNGVGSFVGNIATGKLLDYDYRVYAQRRMIDSSILTIYLTLIVDLFLDFPATATASVNLVRCAFGAIEASTISQMTTAMGLGWSFTLQAGILLLVTPLVWVPLHYGPRYRARRDEKAASVSNIELHEGLTRL
ncbi:MFS general substrate transporter [Lentinula aciculospora]|uniref:MFS general substrate transporter n=1 Tax=Lentinula aciculospora TaxID=153920 RepID=A0A9W8ZYE5_9AGAR|nr:MFS general substrate transporter [Lentinula aciculospora]